MKDVDLIFITQSDVLSYREYSKLPLERSDLFKELVYPRMVYFKGEFHSHLDIYNYYIHGHFYMDANGSDRKKMLNIWNLPGFNGIHIADYLYQHTISTKIINNFDTDWDDLCNTYKSCQVKPVIGISTTFHLSFSETRRMSKKIRSIFPDASILLGGAFINERYINGAFDELESAMRNNNIKYLIHSFNSETDLKKLIESIKDSEDISKVNNLFYFESNEYKKNKLHKTQEIWNPAVLSPINFIDRQNHEFINHTLQIRSSSGCPFSCAFCSYPATAGGFHIGETKFLSKTIQHILSTTRINKFIFIDDTLNVPAARFKEILQTLKLYSIEWFSFLRVQFIDDEIAKLMRESGCRAVYIGVETASDIILQNMNKRASIALFQHGISLLKKYGIITIAAFIIGFPGENDQTIKDDIDFIENSGIDFYTLKEFYFMKQTPVYNYRERFGLSGIGNNWNHNTMNYQTASRIKSEMFQKIKHSIFIDPDTSLWLIAYLYDQGYGFEKIKLLQKEINQIMKEQMNDNFSEEIPAFENIKQLLCSN